MFFSVCFAFPLYAIYTLFRPSFYELPLDNVATSALYAGSQNFVGKFEIFDFLPTVLSVNFAEVTILPTLLGLEVAYSPGFLWFVSVNFGFWTFLPTVASVNFKNRQFYRRLLPTDDSINTFFRRHNKGTASELCVAGGQRLCKRHQWCKPVPGSASEQDLQ